MPLQKTEKLISGTGLFANFLNKPLELGMVLYKDDYHFNIWGSLESLIPGFSLAGKFSSSSKANLNFNNESNVNVKFGANASTTPAAGEVEINFSNKKSGFIVLKEVTTLSLNLGLVNEPVQELWERLGFNNAGKRRKYVLITSLLQANSGSMIYSEEKNNKVILKASNNKPLTTLGIVGEGNVEYIVNTKATIELFNSQPFAPLFAAHRLRANGAFEDIS